MNNEASHKLLQHLYEIVPGRESFPQLSRTVFPNENNVPVNDLLKDLLGKGYIYKWHDDPEQSDEFGLTPRGILFYDGHIVESAEPATPALSNVPIETIAARALYEASANDDEEQTFSFKKIIPIILVIAFAVGLVWYIVHTKS